jgi:LPXTG-motif cell wall-anchored protein
MSQAGVNASDSMGTRTGAPTGTPTGTSGTYNNSTTGSTYGSTTNGTSAYSGSSSHTAGSGNLPSTSSPMPLFSLLGSAATAAGLWLSQIRRRR